MNIVKTEVKSEKIYVYTKYNEIFVRDARSRGGTWDRSMECWIFSRENLDIVKEFLLKIFGEDGIEPVKTVTIDINLDEAKNNTDIRFKLGTMWYGTLQLATRRYRDSQVTLGSGAIVAAGRFCASGGSAKYPDVTYEDGTVLRIKISINLYDRLDKTGVNIVTKKSIQEKEEERTREDAFLNLVREKAELTEKLEEIERLLAEL